MGVFISVWNDLSAGVIASSEETFPVETLGNRRKHV